MSNLEWTTILKERHRRNHPRTKHQLFLGEPAQDDQMKRVEQYLGLPIPEDLASLYRHYNGVGIRSNENEISWEIPPLYKLKEIHSSFVFVETHLELHERYLPFFDWANGDYIGYLYDRNGEWPRLYGFYHERYYLDMNQAWEGFMEDEEMNLVSLLSSY